MTRFSRVLLATVSPFLILAPSLASENAPVYEADVRLMDQRIHESVRDVLVGTVGYQVPEPGNSVSWYGMETARFADMKGKVVVIQSWNNSTHDGKRAARFANRILEGFSRNDVVLVGVHTPQITGDIFEYVTKHHYGVSGFIDAIGSWCDQLGIWETPTAIVLDKNGVIRHAGISRTHLQSAVAALVKEELREVSAPALPPRSERVEDSPVLVKAPDFPSHNKELRGARDVQGKQAPSIEVQEWMNGQPKTDGKVVIVEFWATWCGPCIRNIPHMNELANTFRNDVVAIGISDEASQRVAPFVRGRDIDYAIAIDRSRKLFNFPSPRGIPHAYIQDSEGVVRWQGHPARITERLLAQIVRADKGDTMAEPMRWTDAEG